MKTLSMKNMLLCAKWPTHGFDFTTPEILKVTISDETKKNEKEDKRVKENRVALVWIFILSTLKNKTPWAGQIFFNPDLFWTAQPEKSRSLFFPSQESHLTQYMSLEEFFRVKRNSKCPDTYVFNKGCNSFCSLCKGKQYILILNNGIVEAYTAGV